MSVRSYTPLHYKRSDYTCVDLMVLRSNNLDNLNHGKTEQCKAFRSHQVYLCPRSMSCQLWFERKHCHYSKSHLGDWKLQIHSSQPPDGLIPELGYLQHIKVQERKKKHTTVFSLCNFLVNYYMYHICHIQGLDTETLANVGCVWKCKMLFLEDAFQDRKASRHVQNQR